MQSLEEDGESVGDGRCRRGGRGMSGPVEGGANDLINGEEDETMLGVDYFLSSAGHFWTGQQSASMMSCQSKHGLVFAARERNGGVLGWEQRDRTSFE